MVGVSLRYWQDGKMQVGYRKFDSVPRVGDTVCIGEWSDTRIVDRVIWTTEGKPVLLLSRTRFEGPPW